MLPTHVLAPVRPGVSWTTANPASATARPASATHQSVITVMETARRLGLTQVTFATQSAAQAGEK